MAQRYELEIADQRRAGGLCWLTLHAPDLARSARPGQYVLVRCAEEGSYDPLLRRPLFVAAAEAALGQIALLYAPDERGLSWLARGRAGDRLDVIGALGQPFTLERRTRTLLLLGAGPGLAALLFLARQAAARRCAVALLAGAAHDDLLPPPFLLPGDVEYQSAVGSPLSLLAGAAASQPGGLIGWADQVAAALPEADLAPLQDAVRAAKYRWERGFAAALVPGPLVCGVGACGVCAVETRRGTRLICSDGPVFDLRDLGARS